MQQIDRNYPKMCQVLADREYVGSLSFFYAENKQDFCPTVTSLSETISKRRESMILGNMVCEICTIFVLIGIHLHMNNWDFHVTIFAVDCLNPM